MSKRIIWIDFIKIFACFLVLVLHSIPVDLSENVYAKGLWIYYTGVFAIPLFFMTNGYLQLDKSSNCKYIIKKILNILVIVFFWNIMVYILKYIAGKEVKNPIYESVLGFVQKGEFPHFWFLGSIVIIDVILPLLQKMYKSKYFNKFVYTMIGICILLDTIYVIMYKKNGFILKQNIIQTFRIWTWILYFCLGGYVRKNYNRINKWISTRILIFTVFMIFITVLYEVCLAYQLYGCMYCESFYDSLFVIITSFFIFILFSKIKCNIKNVTKLSSLTMGIYIVHYHIVAIVNKVFFVENSYFRVINLLLIVIISTLISYVISKIPELNKTIRI